MLTPEKILNKSYTPRDLWQTIERLTQLERAIFEHREKYSDRDQGAALWEILQNLPPDT